MPRIIKLAPYHQTPQPPTVHALNDPSFKAASRPKALAFEAVEHPEISIIIPVYNQIDYTLGCIRALREQECKYSFEIIVIDDCSTDGTESVINDIDGIIYIKNATNLQFIKNCNNGAKIASGKYIVFMNNDTVPATKWLSELRITFDRHINVGVVGSKLIYENGVLQEAGAIIWSNGSGWNWGRTQDPSHPMYNFVRDVDYVSGCAFMMERELFLETGGFDTDLTNGYYEDTSKCMQLRALGKRILYQPFSEIVHYEGISNGTDINSGIKSYQKINLEVFVRKYGEQLKGHFPNGMKPEIASDRAVVGHILIVDAVTPVPDQDSGSIDMLNLIKIFIGMGYRVHFIPQTNFAHFGKYTEEMQRMGVECIYAPYYSSVEQFLKERGDCFDFVVLSRSEVATACWQTVKKWAPSAFKIFYTVDLHFLREEREAAHHASRKLAKRAARRRKDELSVIGWADTTIVLSEYEKTILQEQGHENVEVWPLIRELVPRGDNTFADRCGVIFIGGFQHTPNVDAVRWLVDDIWPQVRQVCSARGLPPIRLSIVGSKMPEWILELQFDDIRVVGFAPDLGDIFNDARLSVAPLRYGAGLKGKVATSLGYGVPTIGSHLAFEGMPDDGLGEVSVAADDAAELAECIVDLHEDEKRWREIARSGPTYVARHYSIESVGGRVRNLLERAQKRIESRRAGMHQPAVD